MYYIGVDIGGMSVKIGLVDDDGNVLFKTKATTVKDNPEKVINDIGDCIEETLTKNNLTVKDIAGIGIDGQSWSSIPVGKDGEVLANTPIWMDTRAADICERARLEVGEDRIFEVCGNAFMPSYTMPKVMWFKEHMPDVDIIVHGNLCAGLSREAHDAALMVMKSCQVKVV